LQQLAISILWIPLLQAEEMEASKRLEILLIEHTQTLKCTETLLGQIKQLLNIIAELLEQQQTIGEKATCCCDDKRQWLTNSGTEKSDQN
jgi:hypothetical protein